MEFNEEQVKQIIKEIYEAIKEDGYDPISQLTGYLVSGDPNYICTYKGARNKVEDLFPEDIIEVLLKEFINNEEIRREFISDLASLIEIPSVVGKPDGIYPFGKDCARAVDKALEIAGRFGLKTENHEYHCASAIYGEGEKEVGIIAHLDVVPAERTGWTYEPYKLTLDKGLYIGRGTNDDKGPLLCALYALRYLAENNIKLPFAVRLIMGSDEEVGSSDLEYFKSVRKPPVFSFTPDAEYPVSIGEKGIMRFVICLGKLDSVTSIGAGTVTNAVPGTAFAVVNGKRIETVGRTAHASTPESGINAISLLVDELEKNGLVLPSDKKKFGFLKEAADDYKGKFFGIDFADEYFGYLTCVESVLYVGDDGKAYQKYDVRFPMSGKFEDLDAKIKAKAAEYGFEVVECHASNGYFKSPDSAEIKALTSACEEVLGHECKPYTMGGGTYARSMPGAVAFGGRITECFGLLGEGRGSCHDVDEYYAVEEADKSIEIFVKALTNLTDVIR